MFDQHIVTEPKWMEALITVVSVSMTPDTDIARVCFNWIDPESLRNGGDQWLIHLYIQPFEASGGEHDGRKMFAGFHLDVTRVASLFNAA